MRAGNWAGLGVLFLIATFIFPPALIAALVCFVGMIVALYKAPKKNNESVPFYALVMGAVGAAGLALGCVVFMLWLSGEYDHFFF